MKKEFAPKNSLVKMQIILGPNNFIYWYSLPFYEKKYKNDLLEIARDMRNRALPRFPLAKFKFYNNQTKEIIK